MASRLIELLLNALSLAEQLEEQTKPSPITLAALRHVLKDAAVELESAGDTPGSDKSAE